MNDINGGSLRCYATHAESFKFSTKEFVALPRGAPPAGVRPRARHRQAVPELPGAHQRPPRGADGAAEEAQGRGEEDPHLRGVHEGEHDPPVVRDRPVHHRLRGRPEPGQARRAHARDGHPDRQRGGVPGDEAGLLPGAPVALQGGVPRARARDARPRHRVIFPLPTIEVVGGPSGARATAHEALIFGAERSGRALPRGGLPRRGGHAIGVSRRALPAAATSRGEQVLAPGPRAPAWPIFQLAAASTTRHDALFENHETISTGALNVLEAARLHAPSARVLIVGSGVQFANTGAPISERDAFEASSPYAVARIHSVYAARYFRRLGVRA